MRWSSGQALLGSGVVVAIVAVIAGVRVAGTPGEGRMERLDNVRAGVRCANWRMILARGCQ